jgi:hypothetical protein
MDRGPGIVSSIKSFVKAKRRINTPVALALVALVLAIAAISISAFLQSSREAIPLSSVPPGISHHDIDSERIFLMRRGQRVIGFLGRSTHLNELIVWCSDERVFLWPGHGELWDEQGRYVAGPQPRDLDRVPVTVKGGNVVVDAHNPQRSPGRSKGYISPSTQSQYRRFMREGLAASSFCSKRMPNSWTSK